MEVGYRDRMIFQYFYPSLSLHLISIKLGTREEGEEGGNSEEGGGGRGEQKLKGFLSALLEFRI